MTVRLLGLHAGLLPPHHIVFLVLTFVRGWDNPRPIDGLDVY